MTFDDLPSVQIIERASFSTPWPPQAYRQELASNRLAHYLVAVVREEIVLEAEWLEGCRGAPRPSQMGWACLRKNMGGLEKPYQGMSFSSIFDYQSKAGR